MKRQTLWEAVHERVVVFDGGMGTALFEKGLGHGEAPELWNVNHPDIVREIHRSYLQAGAEAILTNTFGGTPVKLSDSGLEARAKELNRAGGAIARSAASEDVFVVGDIGPTGKMLEPYGELKEADLSRAFEEQITGLLAGGVDALILETQMDLREAVLGIREAKRLTSLPVIASFTFNKTKRGFFTLMGNSVQEAICGAEDAGADMVGTNCSLDSRQMKDLVTEIHTVTSRPVYAKANAGSPELVEGKVVYAQPVDAFLKDMPHYLENGVRMIGGCCGTTPAFIRGLHQMCGNL